MTETLTLTQEEIDERTAILRRLRTLLEMQRKKFQEYLCLLEKQETSIKANDAEIVASQAELEEQIVKNISNLQRVIKPIEEMYHNVYPKSEELIPKMKTDLANLQNKVLAQNEINRNLLKNNIAIIRNQISKLKNPYAMRKSIYATEASAAVVDFVQ